MDDKINVTVENGVKTLEVRHGEALTPKDRNVVNINGNIDSPKEFLKFREITSEDCHIEVDREKRSISLLLDATSPYPGLVKGQLDYTENFIQFQINTGREWNIFQLADFIKLRKSFFPNKTEASKLVTELRNFKAKVNKELEEKDDRRGNTDYVRRQTIESNLPESFKLKVKIFKGFPEFTFNVEVAVNPDTFECTLVSEEAAEIIEDNIDNIVDDEVDSICELQPMLAIIEK